MRFNNERSKIQAASIYFFLGTGIFIALLYLATFQENLRLTQVWYYILISLIIVLVYIYNTAKYFEFDGGGNALTFINRGLLASSFINYREHRAEFPKEKLKGYKIKNYVIYCKLNIYVKSRTNRIKRVSFNISLLNNNKKKALKRSLDTVLKFNNTT